MSRNKKPKDSSRRISSQLTLEDEFTLSAIRKNAHASDVPSEREQYLWETIVKFVSRERAFKSLLDYHEIYVDINVRLFSD